MTRLHIDKFMDQRSRIKAIFGSLKKMHGNTLRSRRFKRQSQDAAIRITCFNIIDARSHTETRRRASKSLVAIALGSISCKHHSRSGTCALFHESCRILQFQTYLDEMHGNCRNRKNFGNASIGIRPTMLREVHARMTQPSLQMSL